MRMRAVAIIVAGSTLWAGSVLAGERVRVNGQCVDIQAAAVPLADLLDELAQRTGVQLAFEGANPRQTITVDLKCGKPIDALLGVLEGQGLNYVVQMSPDGVRIEKLLLIAQGDKKSTADSRATPPGFPAAGEPPMSPPHSPPEPHMSAEATEIPEEDVAEKLPPGFVHSPATVLEGPLPPGGALRIDAQPSEGKQIMFPPGFVQSPPRELSPAGPVTTPAGPVTPPDPR
jgi:hypothetical protein